MQEYLGLNTLDHALQSDKQASSWAHELPPSEHGCVFVLLCQVHVVSCQDLTRPARGEGLVPQAKSLGSLQNLKASNEIAKQHLLEQCGSEIIHACTSVDDIIELWPSIHSYLLCAVKSASCVHML